MTTQTCRPGQIYYTFSAALRGRDMDPHSPKRDTREEAEDDASDWLGRLSEDERESAEVVVTGYRITAVDDGGTIAEWESLSR